MQCSHCGNEVAIPDYRVPQTTVYPDINKCYPYSGYTSAMPNVNSGAPAMTSQWVINNTTMLNPMPSMCSGGLGFNPVYIDLTGPAKQTLTLTATASEVP